MIEQVDLPPPELAEWEKVDKPLQLQIEFMRINQAKKDAMKAE
jgi:hypothetical protein